MLGKENLSRFSLSHGCRPTDLKDFRFLEQPDHTFKTIGAGEVCALPLPVAGRMVVFSLSFFFPPGYFSPRKGCPTRIMKFCISS